MSEAGDLGVRNAPAAGLAPLLRRTAVVTLVRIGLLGCWFVAMIWAYRQIGQAPDGVAQAGVLALLLAGVKLFTTALSDPLDLDVVRRVPGLTDPLAQAAVWRGAQHIRLGLALLVLLGALAGAGAIATWVLKDPASAPAVRLAGVAAALELAFRGYLSDQQSRERFGRFLTLEATLQAARIGGLAAITLSMPLTAAGFLAAYAGATAASLVFGVFLSGRERMRLLRLSLPDMAVTWRYGRWIGLAMLLAAVVERLDIFLLTALRGPAEAGLYGALLPLLLVPEMIAGFATHALQPRIADLEGKGQLLAFWKGLLRLTVPVALAAAVAVALFAEPLIRLTIGPAFVEAAPALRVLFAAVMLWVGIVPVALSLVVMTLPRATLAITAVQALAILAAGALLIPLYGPLGAALAVLAMRVTAGGLICAVAWHRLHRT